MYECSNLLHNISFLFFLYQDAYWTSSTDGSYSYTTVSLRESTDYRLYYSGIIGTKAFAGYIYSTYHKTDSLIAKGTTAGYNNVVR